MDEPVVPREPTAPRPEPGSEPPPGSPWSPGRTPPSNGPEAQPVAPQTQPAGPAVPPAGPPPSPAGPPPGRPGRVGLPLWVLAVAALVIAVVAGLLGGLVGRSNSKTGTTTTAQSANVNAAVCDARTVADRVLPAVVTITVKTSTGAGTGSGEIVRSDGYILTNNHVVASAAAGGTIEVLYSSGQAEVATLIGRDARLDLAVIKVSPTKALPTITFGNSESLRVGQPVVALGSPLGLSGSVTSGIVSALGRDLTLPAEEGGTTVLSGAIQTDASINPGNSGGPLVDCSGALVGVNTAIATVPNAAGESGGGSVGIGFAISGNIAHNVADQFIATGTATYPYFGVSVSPISAAVARQFGVPGGLYVESVTPNGPADQAGIRAGDIITQVDGRSVTTVDALVAVALGKKAGDKVQVTYLRDGRKATTTVTLANRP